MNFQRVYTVSHTERAAFLQPGSRHPRISCSRTSLAAEEFVKKFLRDAITGYTVIDKD